MEKDHDSESPRVSWRLYFFLMRELEFMGTEKRPAKNYSPEVRERFIKMVLEHEGNYANRRAAIYSIAGKIGCHPKTLRIWLHQAERDRGLRPGPTSEE